MVPLRIVLNFSRFKPALNWNRFLGDLRRGIDSLNSDTGYFEKNGNFLSQNLLSKSKSKKPFFTFEGLQLGIMKQWRGMLTKLKNISSSQKPVLTVGNTWFLTELYKSFTSRSTMAYWKPWLSRRRSISTRLETVLFTLYSLYRWNTSFLSFGSGRLPVQLWAVKPVFLYCRLDLVWTLV